MNRFMHGASWLLGDNRIPGVQIPEKLQKYIPKIFQTCRDYGLDFYPTVVQMLTYDEISEIAAYGGFPVRYPHWQWGMEYEELQQGYMYGMHRIYEMVINSNPCYIYCLDSNTLIDNITVIAHALGHNDFFKNNIFFSSTDTNSMNQLANNGSRIRRYIARWGKEKVTEFIDNCFKIQTLIDTSKAWDQRQVKDLIVKDSRKYKHPERTDVQEGHEYMDDYINTREKIEKQRNRIVNEEIAEELEIFRNPTKDIMGFLRDNAPLKPWQQDVMAMLYNEALYFAPQRTTKMMNEGWASFIDSAIMCREGLVLMGMEEGDSGIVEYSKHKAGVLGGKYSTNPYKLGYSLFLDIEERWNKGRFGAEYDECTNLEERMNWDKNLGLGKEKIFEVRKQHNDLTALLEFFTPEFCGKHEFFNWKREPNGDIILENRNFKKIKQNMIRRYMNGGLPEINLVDINHRNKNIMLLEHKWEGQILNFEYVEDVLCSLNYFWKKPVMLTTKDEENEEVVFIAQNKDVCEIFTRAEYEQIN